MITRRDFLRGAASVGAAATLGLDPWPAHGRKQPVSSLLQLPARYAPIDTIVVLMMENRSFDHYMGWLAQDREYIERGRRLWGRRFRVEGSTRQRYRRPDGSLVHNYPLLAAGDANPWRGCGHPDPGHGWNAGRRQRDSGFLAAGSGNDEFAVSYYRAQDLPFYTALNRRFTICDRYHCSVLGPTFPNREYLHSAQSGGIKNNALPFEVGHPNGFSWPTIWDRLAAAGVPARYYYVDLPTVLLWGERGIAHASVIEDYFDDAAAGRLPSVVFLDPGLIGDTRTDEHPHGDVRDGQRLVQRYLKAFVESPHWERGVFIQTYDEWGGFYDHVRPPRVRDDRASRDDQEDFGQLGFRVPTRLISPYARPNFVDHNLYDHTSILRFIEWRFLGAPARGPGRRGDSWFLTTRDRFANNIGWSLLPGAADFEFDPDAFADPGTSPPCGREALAARPAAEQSDFARGLQWAEDLGYRLGSWLPPGVRSV